MKKYIIILLFVLVSFQISLSNELEFYGYIYKSPITMKINIDKNGQINGEYFYDKYQKNIIISGNLLENNSFILKTSNMKELFEGYLLNYNEVENNRLIGRWKNENENLSFEVRKQKFSSSKYYYKDTGLNINPFDDSYIEAKEMEVFPELIFNTNIDLGSGHSSPTGIDYTSTIQKEDFLNELLNLAEDIRSDLYGNFGGSIVYAQQRYYDFSFLEPYYAPKMMLEKIKKDQYNKANIKRMDDYFLIWSFESVYNFKQYNKFKRKEVSVRKNLISFYTKKYDFLEEDAKMISEYIVNNIQGRAYGSAPYMKISKLLQKIINNDDINEIIKEIDNEKHNEEIFLSLNASILLKRNNQIIEYLLKKVNTINNFDESPISSSIFDISILKILLQNKFSKIDINHKNWFGKTPIYYAIQYNEYKTVEFLIDNGANVNEKYNSKEENEIINYYSQIYYTKRTPLMHSAQNSDVKMLKLLIDKGADINETDEIGYNSLDYAIIGKNKDNIKYLKQIGLTESKNK